MALDMNALRAKLDRFKNQGERSNSFWRPKEGKQVIRIVPWAERPENPFIETYFHYLGNKTHLSPKTYGKPDPILEFGEHLRGDGSKEAWQNAKPFFPKLRTFVPVIVRDEEDQGVRFWSFGKTVLVDLLSFIDDEDYGDITDPETGRDITVEYIPQEKSDTNFAKTKVRPKPNQTPLSEDDELVEAWTTDQPAFRSLFKEHTYEELKSFLEKYLDPDSEQTGPSSAATETLSPPMDEEEEPKKEKKAKSKPKTDKVADDFDEMFGDDD